VWLVCSKNTDIHRSVRAGATQIPFRLSCSNVNKRTVIGAKKIGAKQCWLAVVRGHHASPTGCSNNSGSYIHTTRVYILNLFFPQCVSAFCMNLTIKSDYFSTQCQADSIYKWTECVYREVRIKKSCPATNHEDMHVSAGNRTSSTDY
jgi:hypothetical protein